MLKKVLEGFGIEGERLRLEWISASEGKRFVEVTNAFVDEIRSLGPLNLKRG